MNDRIATRVDVELDAANVRRISSEQTSMWTQLLQPYVVSTDVLLLFHRASIYDEGFSKVHPLNFLNDFCAQHAPTAVALYKTLSGKYIIMAALCNRAGHYIFALWFLHVSIFLSFFISFFFFFLSFYLSIFFPGLISAAADWMSTILLHMVWR